MPFWRRSKAAREDEQPRAAPELTSRERRRLSKPQTNSNGPLVALKTSQHKNSPHSSLVEGVDNTVRSESVGFGSRDLRKSVRSQALESVDTFTTALEAFTSRERLDGYGYASRDLSPIPSGLPYLHPNASHESRLSSKAQTSARKSTLNPGGTSVAGKTRPASSLMRTLSWTVAAEEEPTSQDEDSSPISPLEEAQRFKESIDPLYAALIRRRSFATPGVATRNPGPNNRKTLQQPPSSYKAGETGRRTWSIDDMKDPSPLSRFASISRGRESPLGRAETPAEGTYSHLGSLGPGTLVVTNGAISPELTDEPTRARGSDQGVDRSCSQDLANFHRMSAENRTQERSQPLSILSSAVPGSGRLEAFSGDGTETHQAPTERGLTLPVRTAGQTLDYQTYSNTDRDEPQQIQDNRVNGVTGEAVPADMTSQAFTRSASHYARGYLSEIPTSPFAVQSYLAPSDPSAPSIGVLTQAHEDPHDAMLSPEEQYLSEPEQPVASELGSINSPDLGLARTFSSSSQSPSIILGSDAPNGRIDRPVRVKTDSGYSSAAHSTGQSVPSHERSDSPEYLSENLKGRLFPRSEIQIPRRRARNSAVQADPADAAANLYTFEQMLHSLPPAAANYLGLDDRASRERKVSSKSQRGSMLRSLSWGRKTTPANVFPVPAAEKVKSDGDPKALSSTASKSTKKLNKPRPKSIGPIAYPDLGEIESVPRIPTPMKAKFSDRAMQEPGGNPSGVNRAIESDAGERKARFQSGESLDVDATYTEQDDVEETFKRDVSKSRRWSWAARRESNPQPPTPPEHRRTKSKFKRSSRQEAEAMPPQPTPAAEEVVSVANFGIAAQALGSSPYDIAYDMSDLAQRPPRPFAGVVHPHHVSTNVVQSKSWNQMDDAAAAEFARMRSKYRTQARERAIESAQRRSMLANRPPDIPKRPHSHHEVGLARQDSDQTSGLGHSWAKVIRNGGPVLSKREAGGTEPMHDRFQNGSEARWEIGDDPNRSRLHKILVNEPAPPMPPLHHLTAEAQADRRDAAAVQQNMDDKTQPQRRRSKSHGAPGHAVQGIEPTWTASADLWHRRRMEMTRRLQAQAGLGPAAPHSRASRMAYTRAPSSADVLGQRGSEIGSADNAHVTSFHSTFNYRTENQSTISRMAARPGVATTLSAPLLPTQNDAHMRYERSANLQSEPRVGTAIEEPLAGSGSYNKFSDVFDTEISTHYGAQAYAAGARGEFDGGQTSPAWAW